MQAKNYKEVYLTMLNEGLASIEAGKLITDASVRKIGETTLAFNNRIKTFSKTFSHGTDNLINFNNADNAGIMIYKYGGNPFPQRPFCRQHYGKTYTKEQISLMNNGQGLDVMNYCGGYNCLHMWIPVG